MSWSSETSGRRRHRCSTYSKNWSSQFSRTGVVKPKLRASTRCRMSHERYVNVCSGLHRPSPTRCEERQPRCRVPRPEIHRVHLLTEASSPIVIRGEGAVDPDLCFWFTVRVRSETIQRPMLSALTTSLSMWTRHTPTSIQCQSPQEALVVMLRNLRR